MLRLSAGAGSREMAKKYALTHEVGFTISFARLNVDRSGLVGPFCAKKGGPASASSFMGVEDAAPKIEFSKIKVGQP
jgi:hypothetical protein